MSYQTNLDTDIAKALVDRLEYQLQTNPHDPMLEVCQDLRRMLQTGPQPSALLLMDLIKSLKVWTRSVPLSPISSIIYTPHGRALVARLEREYLIARPEARINHPLFG